MKNKIKVEQVICTKLEEMLMNRKLYKISEEWGDLRKRFSNIKEFYSDEHLEPRLVKYCTDIKHRNEIPNLHKFFYTENLFTPIEKHLSEIFRDQVQIPFLPQYPVGKYFVDFGNPVYRIAIEADGAAYHEYEKDRKRDEELSDLGWIVFRVSGKKCYKLFVGTEDKSEDEIYESLLTTGYGLLWAIAVIYFPDAVYPSFKFSSLLRTDLAFRIIDEACLVYHIEPRGDTYIIDDGIPF